MLRTTFLLGALTGLILLFGQYMGGQGGLVIAFVFAVVMNFGSYWFSDKIVLRMYGAQEASEAQAPQLHRIVHNLTVRAGLPMPKLYVIPSEGANAFATGRDPNHAAVAVTQGILRLMDERELTGVLAHELAPRQKPRYSDQLGRRHPGRGDYDAGQYGPVGGDFRPGSE